MGHVQEILAPDVPAGKHETEGKLVASLCLRFLIKWGLARLSLWSLLKLFHPAGFLTHRYPHLPCTFTPLGWKEAQIQVLMLTNTSASEILLKILNLVHSSPSWTCLVSYTTTLHHKLIRMPTCWLLFHFGSNSIIFLQNVTLTTLCFSSTNPVQIVDPSFSPCCLSRPQVFTSDLQMNGGLYPQGHYFTLGPLYPTATL